MERPKGVDAATADRLLSDSLHIISSNHPENSTQLDAEEVRVERDPETGKILRVIADRDDSGDADEIEVAGRKVKRSNPLSDPINDIENGVSSLRRKQNNKPPSASSEFVRQLELRALQEEEAVKKRRPRQQSKREEEWVEKLVARHGDNIMAMVRDKNLNPMQQTEGDIRKRVRIWKERHSG